MKKVSREKLNRLIEDWEESVRPGCVEDIEMMACLLELKQLRAEAGCVKNDTPNCRKPSRVLNKIR
jgi:hypothetical protein